MFRVGVFRQKFHDGDYRKPAFISLLVHVMFLAAIFYQARFLGKKSLPGGQDSAPRLSLVPANQAVEFIPSDVMEKAPSPPQQTQRISDIDTLMRGEQQRNDLDRADQSGINANVVVLRDEPESPDSTGRTIAQTSVEVRNLPEKFRTPASDSLTSTTADQSTPTHTTQNIENLDTANRSQQPEGLAVVNPVLPDVALPDTTPAMVTTQTSETKKSDLSSTGGSTSNADAYALAARPPSRMSFQQQKTQLQGRAPNLGAASWDAAGTTLGEYQAEIYRRVGENWHRMIRERRSLISYGRVVAQLEVSSSGRITGLRLREWPERGTMLGVVSEASIRSAGPFPPFSENLRRQLGDFMQMELTFVVY